MIVDFIFQFVFYSSGSNNDGLPHHESEKPSQQRRRYDNPHIKQNLSVEAQIGGF